MVIFHSHGTVYQRVYQNVSAISWISDGFLAQQPTPKPSFSCKTHRIHVSSQAGSTSTASTASLRYKAMEIHAALSRGASRPFCSGKTWKNRSYINITISWQNNSRNIIPFLFFFFFLLQVTIKFLPNQYTI